MIQNRSKFEHKTKCEHDFRLMESAFCVKCGMITVNSNIAVLHPRYRYKTEASPLLILKQMSLNASCIHPENSSLSSSVSIRKDLVISLRKLSRRLNYSSSTFFLSVAYLDTLLSKNTNTNTCTQIDSSPYLLSLSCLSLAAKFNERDPLNPQLNIQCKLLSDLTNHHHTFTIEDLRKGEVTILNQLNYKLNVFTLYDFILFYFTHGIVLESQVKGKTEEERRKILEQIYLLTRDISDMIIEDHSIIMAYDTIDIAVVLLRKTIDVFTSREEADADVFKEAYQHQGEGKDDKEMLEAIVESLVISRQERKGRTNEHKRQGSCIVESRKEEIVEKTRKLCGRQQLLYDNKLQEIPKTIFINEDNGYCHLQRQMSSLNNSRKVVNQSNSYYNNDRSIGSRYVNGNYMNNNRGNVIMNYYYIKNMNC